LVLANADVSDAEGNEIAVLMFGMYGVNLHACVQYIKDAAQRAKKHRGASISDEEVETVAARIRRGELAERDVLREDLERVLTVKLGDLPETCRNGIRSIYEDLHDKRLAACHAYENGRTAKEVYITLSKDLLATTLNDLKDLLGASNYLRAFGASPQLAAATLFGASGTYEGQV